MLGLLNGVVAVPWIIQIGYVQALPLLLELSIEQGIMDGTFFFFPFPFSSFALYSFLPFHIFTSFWDNIWGVLTCFKKGIMVFIRRLIIGMIFFVFHVRTKSYFFGQGLFSGKGGYMVSPPSCSHSPTLFPSLLSLSLFLFLLILPYSLKYLCHSFIVSF
jgi:hypothetical protein